MEQYEMVTFDSTLEKHFLIILITKLLFSLTWGGVGVGGHQREIWQIFKDTNVNA